MGSPPRLAGFSPTDRKLVDRFVRVPFGVHDGEGHARWVPPLMADDRAVLHLRKNPFFEHADCRLWIATLDGRDVGRIAAIHDLDWEKTHGDRSGYFGFFECANDPLVSGALMRAAMDWLRLRGIDRVLGPFSPSPNYVSGVLVDGFDSEPYVWMPYNPPYYSELLEASGLTGEKDLLQWSIDVTRPVPRRLDVVAELARKRAGASVRQMQQRQWNDEVTVALDVYNDAWRGNWGFVPLGEREFRHLAQNLRHVVEPELAFLAMVDDEPAAISIVIRNVNPLLRRARGRLVPFGWAPLVWGLKVRPRFDSGRLALLGVKSRFRRRGLDALLIVQTYRAAQRLGWKTAELGWTLEENVGINRDIEAAGGQPAKRYRIYGAAL